MESINEIRLIEDFLPNELAAGILERLIDEVDWQNVTHRGGQLPRLVSFQAHSKDDCYPVYRFPSDSLPLPKVFTKHVLIVRKAACDLVGHDLNHCLLQLYRDGNDHISEHADKTLDICPSSNIVNVSFGAQRTMVLRLKKQLGPDRPLHRISLPHNSLLMLPSSTNRTFLHAIRPDKRRLAEKVALETYADGIRLSLTYRRIHTFVSFDGTQIKGGGATSVDFKPVETDPDAWTDLVALFGKENQGQPEYKGGSDALPPLNSLP